MLIDYRLHITKRSNYFIFAKQKGKPTCDSLLCLSDSMCQESKYPKNKIQSVRPFYKILKGEGKIAI